MVLAVKNPPDNAEDIGDVGSIPKSGRSPGGGHGNPLQYSCLENPVDRGAWGYGPWGHSQTRLSESAPTPSQTGWLKPRPLSTPHRPSLYGPVIALRELGSQNLSPTSVHSGHKFAMWSWPRG